jgi:hypothetical protein
MYGPEKIPWLIPITVKESDFISLNSTCDSVITAPEKMLTFKFQKSPFSNDELLWCDLQSTFTGSNDKVLGSARSGFYKGNYLKGMGLTNLAGHWHSESGFYHCSGHMLASAAIREYLISCILKAKGLNDLFIPCNDIFLKSMEESEIKLATENSFCGTIPFTVDKSIIAISSKPGNFSRHSNLSWFLSNNYFHYEQNFFEEFARILEIAFNVPEKVFLRDLELGLDTLLKGIKKGFGNIIFSNINGVYWNSLHNNYTCDGRFLDLEVSSYLGGYCIGEQTLHNDRIDSMVGPPYKLGFEALIQLKFSRIFLYSVISWFELHFLLLSKAQAFKNKKFITSHKAIFKFVKDKILNDVLFNDKLLREYFFNLIISNIDVPQNRTDQLIAEIEFAFNYFLYRKHKYAKVGFPRYHSNQIRVMAYPCEHSENQNIHIPENLEGLLNNNEIEQNFVRESFNNLVNISNPKRVLTMLKDFEISSKNMITPVTKNKRFIDEILKL